MSTYESGRQVVQRVKNHTAWLIKENNGFRVIQDIRELVVFAIQNLIGDAPFSNLDLIGCRNLLIYLEPDIQQKVIEMFHFSLREGGYLILEVPKPLVTIRTCLKQYPRNYAFIKAFLVEQRGCRFHFYSNKIAYAKQSD